MQRPPQPKTAVKGSVTSKKFAEMVKLGKAEHRAHLRRAYKEGLARKRSQAGGVESKEAVDFGDLRQFVEQMSDNERAYIETNLNFKAHRNVALNLDDNALAKNATPSGMMAVCNWPTTEVPLNNLGPKKVDVNKILTDMGIETSKLKLLRAQKGEQVRYFLAVHAGSGETPKDKASREKEFAAINEVLKNLGVSLYFIGDWQDSPYENEIKRDPKTQKRQIELKADQEGKMIHSQVIKKRLDGFADHVVSNLALQTKVMDKTRGYTNQKGEFGGPNAAINSQGKKNGSRSLSAGMVATRLDPRKSGDKTKNSAILDHMERPQATEKLDYVNGDTGFVDHQTVVLRDKDATVTVGAGTSFRPPKDPNDIKEVYKTEAFMFEEGEEILDPRVRELEVNYNIELYERLVLAFMTVRITNPYTNPVTGEIDGGKTNQQFQDEFRNTMAEILGLAADLDYTDPTNLQALTNALYDFDYTDDEKLVKMHEALEIFAATQARGNNGVKEDADLVAFDPDLVPDAGNEWTYNPALTKTIVAVLSRYLQSDAFNQGYFQFVKNPVHPTPAQMKADKNKNGTDGPQMKAHLMTLLKRINRPAKSTNPRSPIDRILEVMHEGLQALGGYPAVNGKTTVNARELEDEQLFTHAEEAASVEFEAPEEKEGTDRCSFKLYTESSSYEHPDPMKKKDKKELEVKPGTKTDRSELYRETFNAFEEHRAKVCQMLQLNYSKALSQKVAEAGGEPQRVAAILGRSLSAVVGTPPSPKHRGSRVGRAPEEPVPPSDAAAPEGQQMLTPTPLRRDASH